MATNPFVFDVSGVINGDGLPETVTQTGPSPSRIGPEMIAIPEGRDVEVEATIIPLGSGVMVDATATAVLEGQCVRCLKELTPTETLRISEVFSNSDDFITGDAEVDEDDEDVGQPEPMAPELLSEAMVRSGFLLKRGDKRKVGPPSSHRPGRNAGWCCAPRASPSTKTRRSTG